MALLDRSRSFLRPTWPKGIFLVEWAAYVLLGLLRRTIMGVHEGLVAVCPLLFFYLIACALTSLSHRTCRLAQGWGVLGMALALSAVDQAGKALVAACVPFQSSLPIVAGWLHIVHTHNTRGSWLLGLFDLPRMGAVLLIPVVLVVLPALVLYYRRYVSVKRRSVWADAAFIALFAGLASWLCDMGLRSYILDYIHLPGVVTADLKDIYLTLGSASLVVEALDAPDLA